MMKFFYYNFLLVHLHHISNKKSRKEVTKQYESRFFLLILLDDRRIQIRIRETKNPTDSTDLDPQHWSHDDEVLDRESFEWR